MSGLGNQQYLGIVDTGNYKDGSITAAKLAAGVIFPSGTAMTFQQTAAPTGWTKQTAHNDKALRVVSGSVGSGGSAAFSAAFASQTPSGSISVTGSVGNTTLDTSMMPSHSHTVGSYNAYQYGSLYRNLYGPNGNNAGGSTSNYFLGDVSTPAAGGGGAHNHSFSGSGSFAGNAINLAVQYVDLIIATKD